MLILEEIIKVTSAPKFCRGWRAKLSKWFYPF